MSAVVASAPRRSRSTAGIAALSFGVFVFALHDVAVKSVAGDYPLAELLFIRSLVALPIIAVVVHFEVGLKALAGRGLKVVLLRSVILLAGYLSFYIGFAAMPFADAVALYSSVPLIVVTLSGPFLGERVGPLRWLAVIVGFVGVVIMLRPGSGVFEPAGLLILLCALLYSTGQVMARGMNAAIPASVMSFYSTLLFLIAAVAAGLLLNGVEAGPDAHPSVAFVARPWQWPPLGDLLTMMSCGVTAAAGIYCLTLGYRIAEANLVASFEYAALIWAALFGYLLFNEVPGLTTIVGALLIVAAGLLALFADRLHAMLRS